jgi:hypothetical protein
VVLHDRGDQIVQLQTWHVDEEPAEEETDGEYGTFSLRG